ncbi:ExbD/TolR family protein [Solemya elarraichensis gill symbiont]|uniref:Biopolymer transporter ExbD n=1 Tax=Solemya elarraichensis gill symbiont TaxID=1918949 RepID=A0A1T2KZQ3_9GAMM|nr:biopolymer transporter ExbD [Solemya elarraichensis gill symbiont]OOZ38250.1 hypothetical protein BOW52_08955 [Solemya elarraichensis gill symbiont]
MKPMAQVNMIPFIDVMLVMLCIILTTATFVAQGKIPIDLPQAKSTEVSQADEHTEIVINKVGEYFVNDKPIDESELIALIGDLEMEEKIRLKVDSDTEFKHFVLVIDEIKAAGLENLAIVTEKK